MALNSLWQSLEASALGSYIASSIWAFPTLETLHVIALVTVVGSVALVDFRLLGLTAKSVPVTVLSRETLWMTWAAFLLALATGLLLFVSKATYYTINPYFLTKMGLLVFAGLNMAIFHVVTWKTVARWDSSVTALPTAAKVAGLLSLLTWVAVVFSGRVIGFTLGIYYPAY